MTDPAVSIVVPCYNGGQFLDTLMSSIDAQTFRDFEVIIVNDGSTDLATLAVLDRLRGRFRVVDQENRHLSGARNTGFRESKAEFVLPLDCDDAIEPNFLAETVGALRSESGTVAFIHTHMRLNGDLNGVLKRRFDRFEQLFLNRLPYCMLIRKSAWSAVGGYDESMRDGMEDWEFNVHLAAAGYRGSWIAKPLFVYTVRSDGMLLTRSVRLQSTLWRYIYSKHRGLYRFRALLNAWRDSRRSIALAAYAAFWLTFVRVMPENWGNAIAYRVIRSARWMRLMSGQISLPRRA
jgi:glycosyltransferase involved in cell wall biosynthesis